MDFDEMRKKVDLAHPRRIVVDKDSNYGKYKKFPVISTPMGQLLSRGIQKPLETDCIGVAVAQYFRLLKAMVKIMISCFLLSLPSLIIFSNGKGYDNDWTYMSIIDKTAMFTMGNLGESMNECK